MNLFFGLEALACPKYSLGSKGGGAGASRWFCPNQCCMRRAWLRGGRGKGDEEKGKEGEDCTPVSEGEHEYDLGIWLKGGE